MQVKGTSVKSTMGFVASKFSSRYDEWIQSLPVKSREIFMQTVLATHWYPANEGLIIPTKMIGEKFFGGDAQKASYAIGRHSAEVGLTGFYKIFVKIAKPAYVLGRSARIFSTYYSGVNFETVEQETDKKIAVFEISGLQYDEVLVLDRTIGWIDKALEVIGTKSLENTYVITKNNNDTIQARIKIIWQ